MRALTTLLLTAGTALTASADFGYSDFSDTSGLQLNGTAHQFGNVVRMTDDGIGDQAGNMWQTDLQGVGNGFSTTFQFRCDGTGEAPADGMAFGIQAVGTTEMGNGGGDNAMGGLWGSVVVNFQSFWNSVQIIAVDPSGNLVSFDQVAFSGLHRTDPWTAVVSYDAASHDWRVSLDGTPVIGSNFDLVSAVGSVDAYVGLGAGTGLGYDANDALSWSVQTVPEPSALAVLVGGGVMARRRRARAT
ncbi:MAG: PEP-CTERM sorting domain-containing protein [Armatimonadetes bacterium]|nr:PEP-CTERM sorting domain-containing protein [Armatimonadota bacterium]